MSDHRDWTTANEDTHRQIEEEHGQLSYAWDRLSFLENSPPQDTVFDKEDRTESAKDGAD